MDLSNTTALVTGANRGIGRAITEALAARGATVLAGVRDPSAFAPLANAQPVPFDLSSQDTIDEAVAALPQHPDLLVNNAGLLTGGLIEEQDLDEIYVMFQVNLVAVTHLTARLLPAMVERGHGEIVNIATISGCAYFPAASTYAAATAGVVA